MKKDNLIEIKKASRFIDDPITQILRNGAKKLLAKALKAEIDSFIDQYNSFTDDQGRTRNGYLPEREIQTRVGPVSVKVPRACDHKGKDGKTKSIETLIPWLYLKGISTGGFTEALATLVGQNAPGLSASTISRLKTIWEDEYQQWQNRDLSKKHYAYIWADGVYCNVRMEDKQCMLVIIGAT